MELDIEIIDTVSPSLADAMAHLMPQLSPRLGAPADEALRRIVADDRTALFAARRAGRIVGLLTLVWYDVPSGRKAWVEDVVVDAAARGAGAGRALVEAAVAHAAGIGAARVLLTSNPSRTAAHALYRSTGFEEAATTLFARDTILR